MSSKKCSIPGFRIDPESGKYIAIPLRDFSFRIQEEDIGSSKKANLKRNNSSATKDAKQFKTDKTDFYSKKCSIPGFEIDPETRKFIPVPFNFSSVFQEDRSKNLNLKQTNSLATKDMDVEQPVKFRKVDAGVRKELFALPVPSSKKTKTSPVKPEHNPKKKLNAVRKSLMKSFPSRSATKPRGTKKKETEPLSDSPQPLNEELNIDNTLRSSDSSVSEFLNMEEMCKTPKIVPSTESPVSSVCTLLDQNLLINSKKKAKRENDKNNLVNVVEELKRLVKNSAELHDKTTEKIKEVLELQKQNEENLKLMTALIDQVVVSEAMATDNKENSNIKRQSLRLQNKISSHEKKAPPATSPVILKAGDLRKSTLTKSLVHKCQKYQISSPRVQKAMNMYNSLVGNCGALQTPKLTRSKLAESPQASNLRKSINEKVMEQCYMLQDTPAHKKNTKN